MNEKPILIVTAGDVKIDNKKYKKRFGTKAKMLSPEEVVELIGYEVGGVCPFGISEVAVYLDESLKRFKTVFPACGSSNSAIELSISELEQYSGCKNGLMLVSWFEIILSRRQNCASILLVLPDRNIKSPVFGGLKLTIYHYISSIVILKACQGDGVVDNFFNMIILGDEVNGEKPQSFKMQEMKFLLLASERELQLIELKGKIIAHDKTTISLVEYD